MLGYRAASVSASPRTPIASVCASTRYRSVPEFTTNRRAGLRSSQAMKNPFSGRDESPRLISMDQRPWLGISRTRSPYRPRTRAVEHRNRLQRSRRNQILGYETLPTGARDGMSQQRLVVADVQKRVDDPAIAYVVNR